MNTAASYPVSVPSSPVQQLDALLTRRLLSAPDADVRAVWQQIVTIKRELEAVGEDQVPRVAAQYLIALA